MSQLGRYYIKFLTTLESFIYLWNEKDQMYSVTGQVSWNQKFWNLTNTLNSGDLNM